MQLATILAASDLRALPDPALEAGGRLAAMTGAALHVFHCLKRSRRDAATAVADIEAARRQLAGEAPGATAAAAAGSPYRAIRDHAAAIRADVIVLGARIRRPAVRMLIGGTTDRVLRTTRLPVLLANDTLPERVARILVAVDDSAHSRRAVTAAATLIAAVVRHTGAGPDRAHLLHISAFAEPGAGATPDELDLEGLAHGLAHQTTGWTGAITHGVLSAPLAGEGIIAYAGSFRPDLVVLGTHGSGPFVRALLGSVALDVASSLSRPLLLVPRP